MPVIEHLCGFLQPIFDEIGLVIHCVRSHLVILNILAIANMNIWATLLALNLGMLYVV